jgi:hypothetical protein
VYTAFLAEYQMEDLPMPLMIRSPFRIAASCLLTILFFLPAQLVSQSHVVSPADLDKELVTASQARQHNLDTVQQFLSTPRAEKAMKSAQIDPHQVQVAVSTLDNEELARIATRADKAQADFAAGALGERDLIWIILAIAVLILVVVAVR